MVVMEVVKNCKILRNEPTGFLYRLMILRFVVSVRLLKLAGLRGTVFQNSLLDVLSLGTNLASTYS
jgi:hypothetical protein